MKRTHAVSHRMIRVFAAFAVAGFAIAAAAPSAFAQSKSGFTYNGMDYISYQATEYLETPQGPDGAADLRAEGANYTAVMATYYVQTYDSTALAPDSSSPTDAAIVAAIKNLQAEGITVTLKPHVDSLDGIWRGDFTWPSTDTTVAEQQAWLTAWFTSYQSFILHFAQIASENNVGIMVIGTEYTKLTGSTCGGSCEPYWKQYVIDPLRASYPNLTLAYGANATSAGDEFTSVSFWDDIDIIGVDGYFPLTNHADPTVAQLVAAWTTASGNVNGFAPEAALANLAGAHPGKPFYFSEIGYTSTAGTNEAPYNYTPTGAYDVTEQEDCYEAFFEVFSQETSWMKGVFWWDWSVSPPGTDDTGYSPQTKPAGTTTLPEWYGSTASGFTLAPAFSSIALGQGLSSTDLISVTPLGGFSGTVTLAVSGLPSGVTGAFSAGTVAGTQALKLTASAGATTGGPLTLTVKGTSGSITATTTIALTVNGAEAQTITFANPGAQVEGTLLALTATSTSGLPVSFSSSTTTICTISSSGTTASLLKAGTCTITASQTGNGIYAAAAPVEQSFQVTALTPVPVPADAEVIVSQVNWLAVINGYMMSGGNPTGSSFAVNSNGDAIVANNDDLILINGQTGAATTLGAIDNGAAVAVDSKNNVYFGSVYNNETTTIVKIPYNAGASNLGYGTFTAPSTATPVCTSTSTTECLLPSNLGTVNVASITVDPKGDLFWATAGSGASAGNAIYECNAACVGGSGSPVLLYQEPIATGPITTTGQLLAGSLAADAAGNLFFTDSATYVNPSTYAYTGFNSHLNELPKSTSSTTGFASGPTVLYAIAPGSPGNYDDIIDAVTVDNTNGIVYFATQNDGIFAFPDTSGGIPLANGQPTALYAASTQGANTLTIGGQDNLYLLIGSSALASGSPVSLAQVVIDNVTAPASPVGTTVSPSATIDPVTTILNDTPCTGSPAPSVNFVASTGTEATATITPSTTCATTLAGGSAFATAVSFTPIVAGSDSISLTGTDQADNKGTVTVSGVGSGFSLSVSSPMLTVLQGSSVTDIISVIYGGGFSGAVTLAATGLPTGVTAGFTPNPTSGGSSLTLTASSTATSGGPVTVTIMGTSGSLSASATIALTVTGTAPSITTQPTNQTVPIGSTATFSVTATGTPTLTYAWQYLSGGTWKTFGAGTGYSTATLTTFATTAAYNGLQLRVVITDGNGVSTTSNTVKLTVSPAITTQPVSQTVTDGSTATFSVVAAGVPTLTYQWQYLAGTTWKSFGAGTGYTTATLTTFATTSAYNGLQFRVVVTDGDGLTVTSNTVKLTVGLAITTQPVSQTVTDGTTATFSAVAAGVPTLTYQWQYLSGTTWKSFGAGTGYTTAALTTFATTAAYNGLQLRVVVTDGDGLTATSNTVTLTVGPAITTQPVSQTVADGSTATFSVTAAGVATLSYQWQYLSGTTWKAFGAGTGYSTATLTTFATTAAYNGLQFRVVVTDGDGLTATSNAVTLTVAPAITTQPVGQTVTAGSTAAFSVVAAGVPTLTYQWQYLSGTTWKAFGAGTGYTTATLTTFATTSAYNGLQFRVVVTDGNGRTATSNTVTLTVSAAP